MYTLKSPLKVACLECQKKFIVRFCPPRQQYSQKNNWGYWTGQKKFNNHYVCDRCLSNLYQHHKPDYLEAITDSKKRRLLRSYFYQKIVEINSEKQTLIKN